MKEYPTIEHSIRYGVPVYMFDKLDGSNIRAEWDRKKGFWKFGKRHGLLDHSNEHLLKAPELIKSKYEKDLNAVFLKERYQRAIAFFEFWGPNSFAGNHDKSDSHTVTLIDIAVDKKGILEPRDFLHLTEGLDIATFIYRGPFNHEIEAEIKARTLVGMTFEGVVCKGSYESPGRPMMFKVKSEQWLQKLKNHCKGDEKLFNTLR